MAPPGPGLPAWGQSGQSLEEQAAGPSTLVLGAPEGSGRLRVHQLLHRELRAFWEIQGSPGMSLSPGKATEVPESLPPDSPSTTPVLLLWRPRHLAGIPSSSVTAGLVAGTGIAARRLVCWAAWV